MHPIPRDPSAHPNYTSGSTRLPFEGGALAAELLGDPADDRLVILGDHPGEVEIHVEVRRRVRPKITVDSPRPADVVDRHRFHKALLAGDLEPGTYRVGFWRSYDVVTIPSRMPTWVRTPMGNLWHRVRYLQVQWTLGGMRRSVPSMAGQTWCGMGVHSSLHRRRRPPTFADEPGQPVCGRCDTSTPDRRRYPDRDTRGGA